MARRLLAQNRADDVARMLEPLLEPANGSVAPDPEQAIVRALLARIALRHRSDPHLAQSLLDPVAPERAPGLAPGPAAEVDLWLAWSQFLSDGAHPYRRLMMIDRAATYFKDQARLADLAWALTARAEIYEALGETGLAHRARQEAGALFQQLPEYASAGAALTSQTPISQTNWPSAVMRAAVERVDLLATTRLPLLLLGERGSGKRALARHFHRASGATGPFVIYQHDGTSPAYALALLEEKRGEAAGGTLFIDELTAVPRAAQDRLLAMHDLSAPTRLAVASTRRLEDAIAGQGVCGECLARLAAGVVHVPPLRMRRDDIPVLVGALLQEMAPAGTTVACLTDAALEALVAYPWPGNVRQLRNELERMFTLLHSEPAAVIDLTDLAPEIRTPSRPNPAVTGAGRRSSVPADGRPDPTEPLDAQLAYTERRVIEGVLIRHRGHITAAAEALGLTRQGLHKKIKRLGIAVDGLSGDAPPDASYATN